MNVISHKCLTAFPPISGLRKVRVVWIYNQEIFIFLSLNTTITSKAFEVIFDAECAVQYRSQYCQGEVSTDKSSLPLNLGTNGFTCLPKRGSAQSEELNCYFCTVSPGNRIWIVQIAGRCLTSQLRVIQKYAFWCGPEVELHMIFEFWHSLVLTPPPPN